jgi:hypothetical protein
MESKLFYFGSDETPVEMISHDYLVVGDYGGASSVGEANIRTLEPLEGSHMEHGAYSSRQLWLPDTEDNRELIASFDNYPCLDDEVLCEVEAEWELEAWNSYVRSDLLRSLPLEVRHVADELEEDRKEILWELYLEAMEKTNSYPNAEDSGVHVPIDRIKDTFGQLVEDEIVFAASKESGIPLAYEHDESTGYTWQTPLGIIADWYEENGHQWAETIRYIADQQPQASSQES